MNRIPSLLAAALCLASLGLPARTEAAPKIQFDRLVHDFGKTGPDSVVTGVFKFKNVGDGLLKVETPKPSCGCTVAELKPDTLGPGASGELPFTLHLGQVKARFDKHILVKSNDPETPEVYLAIKADFTPLYDINPLTLTPKLAYGTDDAVEFTTLSRTDGAPIRLGKLAASQPWITATVEPGPHADPSTTRLRVAIRRQGAPRRFTEFIHVYAVGETNTPVANLYVYGQFLGEVSLSPESLYWSVNDAAKATSELPEDRLTRRVTIRSTNGKPIEVKNAQSTLKDLKLELVPKEAGQAYELVARLDQVPAGTVSGNVRIETSVKGQSVIELPVIVHVVKP